MLSLIVAENIKIRRELRGWKQRDLAVRIGVTPETVSNIEAGRGIKLLTLERIANAFEIDISDLLVKSPIIKEEDEKEES